MDNNISFQSRILVKGQAPDIKELSEMMYQGILKKNRKTSQLEPITQLRTLDLTEDKFSYDKTALFLTGSDVDKLKDIESQRTVQRALDKPITPLSKEFKDTGTAYDAKTLIKALKDKALSVVDLISK